MLVELDARQLPISPYQLRTQLRESHLHCLERLDRGDDDNRQDHCSQRHSPARTVLPWVRPENFNEDG